MKNALFLILGLLSASLVSATDLKLPPNLEIVSQDSLSITVKNKDTGIVRRMLLDGEPKDGPGWEIDTSSAQFSGKLDIDTCSFDFRRSGYVPLILNHTVFGDANRNGLSEIGGTNSFYDYIFEYSGHDTTYNLLTRIYWAGPMDYGADTDHDGKLEMMATGIHSMDLFESPDSFSIPTNKVFSWPWNWEGTLPPGKFADLDGDGITEITFRPNLMNLTALRATGDNQYQVAYYIPSPESLLDNYYDYIWGDIDGDGRNEVVTTGSEGRVLCFENVAPDSFALKWAQRVRYFNSFWLVGPTDLDCDGRTDFVVMSASFSRGGFFFYWFENNGDNSFEQVYTDSLPGNTLIGGSLKLYDMDNDGIDEFIVSSYNWIGIYKADGDNHLRQIYLLGGYNPDIPVYDLNQNGYGELILTPYMWEYTPQSNLFGDINQDCRLTLQDPLFLVNYFKGQNYHLPSNIYQADANGDCQVNGLDVLYLINYFKGGPELINGSCR